ncbi:hypothetical protein M885DRAFT_612091 [Pelagophyceae sp. CCMP2097]|nr:hypothetical protein M885DRAFT_612091 [Pelagophyceae sp. CCMP2097]
MVLVALIGAPGAGKTSLGQRVAAAAPEACTFVSIGEEMRRRKAEGRPSASAEAIVAEALRIPKAVCVVDGAFWADGLLRLLDVSDSVVVLHVDTPERACREALRARGRAADDVTRVERWHRHSKELLRVAQLLGVHAVDRAATPEAVLDMVRDRPPMAVVGPSRAEALLQRLRTLLRVHDPRFAMPRSLRREDLGFVMLNDYRVARKADGERCWLFSFNAGEAFTMTRDATVRRAAHALPAGCVLDCEVVAIAGREVALAFDALALHGAPVWQRALDSRVFALAEMLAAAPPQSVRLKPHYGLDAVEPLLRRGYAQSDFDGGVDYKVDGLVFTPNIAYCYDSAVPLFKHQSPGDVSFDLDEAAFARKSLDDSALDLFELCGGGKPDFGHGGIAVCAYVSTENLGDSWPPKKTRLAFQRMRYDKRSPNSPATIAAQLALCRAPLSLDDVSATAGATGAG